MRRTLARLAAVRPPARLRPAALAPLVLPLPVARAPHGARGPPVVAL
jgi:hypothetical protein